MEAAGLGLFMLSASLFATFLEHPASPLRRTLPSPLLRRALMGLAMGGTAVGIIYSPWGKRSGAHSQSLRHPELPPAGQGWLPGMRPSTWPPRCSADSPVSCSPSRLLRPLDRGPPRELRGHGPRPRRPPGRLRAEALISLGMMLTVLTASNAERLARYTGLIAALLVTTYITFEASLSGMSIEPRRESCDPPIPAGTWSVLWIYLTPLPSACSWPRSATGASPAGRRDLRQAPPPQRQALHLPVRVRRAGSHSGSKAPHAPRCGYRPPGGTTSSSARLPAPPILLRPESVCTSVSPPPPFASRSRPLANHHLLCDHSPHGVSQLDHAAAVEGGRGATRWGAPRRCHAKGPPEAVTQPGAPRAAEASASSLPTGTETDRLRTLLEINKRPSSRT